MSRPEIELGAGSEPPDLGFNTERLQVTRAGVKSLLQFKTSTESFGMEEIARILAVLDTQEEFAQRRTTTRRRLIQGAVAAAGTLALVTVGYNKCFSPEVARERQEKTLKEKIDFERTNTLGVEPSSASRDHWRIRYPKLDPNIKYQESLQKEANNVVDKSNYIKLPAEGWWSSKRSTGIVVEDYTRLDGVVVPKLKINLEGSGWEEWILRTGTEEGTDTSVVWFENTIDRGIIPVSITKTKSKNSSSYRVVVMEAVRPED